MDSDLLINKKGTTDGKICFSLKKKKSVFSFKFFKKVVLLLFLV